MSNIVDKVVMFNIPVSDMDKAKAFYTDKLGMKVITDIGQGSMHWITLASPGGGPSVGLTTAYGNAKPGTMNIQLSTSDIQESFKQLNAKGIKPTTKIMEDYHGPGSGVKGFQVVDPDGDILSILQ